MLFIYDYKQLPLGAFCSLDSILYSFILARAARPPSYQCAADCLPARTWWVLRHYHLLPLTTTTILLLTLSLRALINYEGGIYVWNIFYLDKCNQILIYWRSLVMRLLVWALRWLKAYYVSEFFRDDVKLMLLCVRIGFGANSVKKTMFNNNNVWNIP